MLKDPEHAFYSDIYSKLLSKDFLLLNKTQMYLAVIFMLPSFFFVFLFRYVLAIKYHKMQLELKSRSLNLSTFRNY